MEIHEEGWLGGWDANTEMKIQDEGWLVGMQIQMQIEENLGVVQLGCAPHYWIILHP